MQGHDRLNAAGNANGCVICHDSRRRVSSRAQRCRRRCGSGRGCSSNLILNEQLRRALCHDVRTKRVRRLHLAAIFAQARRLRPSLVPIPECTFVSLDNFGCGAGGSVGQQSVVTWLDWIPLASIDGRPFRLRVIQNDQEQAEFAASIVAFGVHNPIHVRPLKNRRFQMVDGERRLRALQDLQHTDVAALVVLRTATAALLDAILLNTGRRKLSDYERAKAYQQLLGMGAVRFQQDLARLSGCFQAKVYNIVGMLKLRHPYANFWKGIHMRFRQSPPSPSLYFTGTSWSTRR